MGYLKASIGGVSWVAGQRILTRIVAFLKIAIIARILSPSQFGLFDVAVLAFALIEIFAETGINVFLIQESKSIKKYLGTAWAISILRGLLISAVIIFLAPVVAIFFQAPESFKLLILISLVPLIRGFINPSVVIIQKELLFKKDFFFRSTIFIFDSFASVFFVLLLRSPSGIVLGLIFGAMLEVMISIAFLRPIPKLEIKKNYVKQIFHKGKWVTFSGVFNYLYHNLDDVVVGRLAGIGSLGLYGMAYNFSTLPISEIADVLSKVTFPVYVKIGGDINRLKKAFFKTIIFVSLLSFPLGLVIIIFPSQIIHLVLGENWIEAAPALQILGIFGIIRAISGTTSSLFLAVQKQKYVAVVTFVSFVALGIFVIPLVLLYGIVGASIASVIGAIAALPVMAYYTHRVLYINEKSRS